MVITEEKILSNIEKVQRLINPNSKKQIVELDDSSYFKDLVESIKTYLVEYPKKKNFPKNVYDAAYNLVEYATNQFEENTKQVNKLIEQREFNIKSAAILKQTLSLAQTHANGWQQAVINVAPRYDQNIEKALNVIGTSMNTTALNYQTSLKQVNAKIVNLQSNLHIEIDMERVEDRSKALSYIGIEIADALKLIPTPVGFIPGQSLQQAAPVQALPQQVQKPVMRQVQMPIQNQVAAQYRQQQVAQTTGRMQAVSPMQQTGRMQAVNPNMQMQQTNRMQAVNQQQMQNTQRMQVMQATGRMPVVNQQQMQNSMRMQAVNPAMQATARMQAVNPNMQATMSMQALNQFTMPESQTKQSFWQKFKNSKFIRAIKNFMGVKVVLELPEGTNQQNMNQF
jgi:hypothetical protein